LRPHIVWFGEDVPLLTEAARITAGADILIIIGTSMQVYPAASLIHYVRSGIPKYFVDPNPTLSAHQYDNLEIITKRAAEGVPILVADLVGKEL
ncbi:MAG: NAD-dependent deacylase, partial [Flavobacteriaceae bacterium]|nr:NAD-dependent deacylase [Flavobacteriaceae bacterium]